MVYDNYTFLICYGVHFKSMCKRIMDLGVFKHITLHKATFDTYEVTAPRNLHLDNNNVVEAITIDSIVLEAIET